MDVFIGEGSGSLKNRRKDRRIRKPLFAAFLVGLLSAGFATTALAEGSAELFGSAKDKCAINSTHGIRSKVYVYLKDGEKVSVKSGQINNLPATFTFARVSGSAKSFNLNNEDFYVIKSGEGGKYQVTLSSIYPGFSIPLNFGNSWDINVTSPGSSSPIPGRLGFSLFSIQTLGSSCKLPEVLFSKTEYLGSQRVFRYETKDLIFDGNGDLKVFLRDKYNQGEYVEYTEEIFFHPPDPNYFKTLDEPPVSYASLNARDFSAVPFDKNSSYTTDSSSFDQNSCAEYPDGLVTLGLSSDFSIGMGAGQKEIICFIQDSVSKKFKQLPLGSIEEGVYRFKNPLEPGKYRCIAPVREGRRVKFNMVHLGKLGGLKVAYVVENENGGFDNKPLKIWWDDKKELCSPAPDPSFVCSNSCSDACGDPDAGIPGKGCMGLAECCSSGKCYSPVREESDKISSKGEGFDVCYANSETCNAKGWSGTLPREKMSANLYADLIDSVEYSDIEGYDFIVKVSGDALCDIIPEDADTDEDGISDRVECGGVTSYSACRNDKNNDSNGDGTFNYEEKDSDGDGIPDSVEAYDRNGDGKVTGEDFGETGTTVLSSSEILEKAKVHNIKPKNTDGEGKPDYQDTDSDGDGIPDKVEAYDTDGDGKVTEHDFDENGDKTKELTSEDILKKIETSGKTPLDSDKDGVPDYLDIDSDNDGIPDLQEGHVIKADGSILTPVGHDWNENGLDDAFDPACTEQEKCVNPSDSNQEYASPVARGEAELSNFDKDTRPDYRDLDSDGDGIPDYVEAYDRNKDGKLTVADVDSNVQYGSDQDVPIDPAKQADLNEQGINSTIGTIVGKDASNLIPLADADGDGHPNFRDLDSDNDGIPDKVEAYANPDENALANQPENQPADLSDPKQRELYDKNGNGIDDRFDRDCVAPSMALLRAQMAPAPCVGGPRELSNTNKTEGPETNGTPNYLDPDSDGDNVTDNTEAFGGNEPIGNGPLEYDSNNNGLDDRYEDPTVCHASSCTPVDQNNAFPATKDNKYDYLNPAVGKKTPIVTGHDTDGDKIPDEVECGPGAKYYEDCVDSDNDGKADYEDWDSDNDGIPDIDECDFDRTKNKCQVEPAKLDYRKKETVEGKKDGDADYDGDGIPNKVECGIQAFDSKGGAEPKQRCRNTDDPSVNTLPNGSFQDDLPDFRDKDSDGDGIPDDVECKYDSTKTSGGYVDGCIDTDNDKTPDYRDTDSDGDNVDDISEGVIGADGLPVTPVAESDRKDGNNNGIEDHVDVACLTDNVCSDVAPGKVKVSKDNNGRPDLLGGVDPAKKAYVDDTVQPGKCPAVVGGELHVECTGLIIPNHDYDGDGIADSVECGTALTYAECEGTTLQNSSRNLDNDGMPPYRDLDSDGDGIPDKVECDAQFTGLVTRESDCKNSDGGTPNADTDPDYLDIDSDGDGVDDNQEGVVDAQGHVVPPPTTDAEKADINKNGIYDVYEPSVTGSKADSDPSDPDGKNPKLLDGTAGKKSYVDPAAPGKCPAVYSEDQPCKGKIIPGHDYDNDGINDKDECSGSETYKQCDDANAGHGPYRKDKGTEPDPDSSTPTCPSADEQPTKVGERCSGTIRPNNDHDGDGIPDEVECEGYDTYEKCDANRDKGSYRDLDSDGDGLPDADECEYDQENSKCTIDQNRLNPYNADTNNDGVSDGDEDYNGDGQTNATQCGNVTENNNRCLDTNSDGIPDFREFSMDGDEDNDGIPNRVECTLPDRSDPLTEDDCKAVDTDNDGVPDYKDKDSDNDGILDEDECPDYEKNHKCRNTDADASMNNPDKKGTSDQIPDFRDVDSDGDGIPDAVETGRTTGPGIVDPKGDGIGENYKSTTTVNNVDGDGNPPHLDSDSDGDGIPDIDEAYTDGNGVAITPVGRDSNKNGIDDAFDAECKGSANECEDDHGTTYPSPVKVDETTGLPVPANTDKKLSEAGEPVYGDELPDYLDKDSDGDGIPDKVECRKAASPTGECVNTDKDADNGDNHPDFRDTDSDADGVKDYEEGVVDENDQPVSSPAEGRQDENGNGIEDHVDLECKKEPATCNNIDVSVADNDSNDLPDLLPGTNGKNAYVDKDAPGTPVDPNDNCQHEASDLTTPCKGAVKGGGNDHDGDGIPDEVECRVGTKPVDRYEDCVDTDKDGKPDYMDKDSDNDGILDEKECPNGKTDMACPGGDDLGMNYRESADSDRDGIPNSVECVDPEHGVNTDGTVNCGDVNTDGDKVPDYMDEDSDGDGIPDKVECKYNAENTGAGFVKGCVDTDENGVPNFRDKDSDGDNVPDNVEGVIGENGLPVSSPAEGQQDKNGNGIEDHVDLACKKAGACGDGFKPSDVLVAGKDDSDDEPKLLPGTNGKDAYVDKDAFCTPASEADMHAGDLCKGPIIPGNDHDGDGIPDQVECGPNAATYADCETVNHDKDGNPDYRDVDDDGDGIRTKIECPDYEAGCPNADGDADPDYLDTDSDNDGTPDGHEAFDTDNDGTPDRIPSPGEPGYKDENGDGLHDDVSDKTSDDLAKTDASLGSKPDFQNGDVSQTFGFVAGGCSATPSNGSVPTSLPILGLLFGLSFFRRRRKE